MASRAQSAVAREWHEVGERPAPSWYLDPVVAEQKRRVHQALIRLWLAGRDVRRVWKTDLFEEANGPDAVLFGLFPPSVTAIGTDIALATALRASRRAASSNMSAAVCDVTASALRPSSLDAVISLSTLDHVETRDGLDAALAELAAALRPGGVLIITLHNPHNPLSLPLRWYSRTRFAPFRVGETFSARQLRRRLAALGFDVIAEDTLLHNPRMFSTVLFLGIRTLLGARADGVIRSLLGAFALLGALPTRRFTACFIAACAVKR